MDINHIIQFISVAQTHSFSEAARRNYVSQSMVSRNMAAMEREIQTKLFVRTNREVTLTTEGKILLPFAIEIAESLDSAKKTIYRIHCGMEGRIKILHDMLSGDIAVDYIEPFCKKHPKIIVDIASLYGSGDALDAHNSGCDFLFVLDGVSEKIGGLNSIEVGYDELCMVMPRSFDGICMEELWSQKLILPSPAENPVFSYELERRLTDKGINTENALRYDSIYNVMIAVGSGLGVSLLPQKVARKLKSESTKLVPISGMDTQLRFVLAWKPDNANPAARVFVHTARKVVREKAKSAQSET